MKKEERKKMSKAEAGRLGGMATKRKHGLEHYRRAGSKGFMVTVARHWFGDKEGYLHWLRARGWLHMVDRLHRADPSAPVCIELPPDPYTDDVALDPDEDPLAGFHGLIDHVLASIRSAPIPEGGGL
jgi:hypothetical protein